MDNVVWNLTEINALFKAVSRDHQTFRNNYGEWVVQRKSAISVFQKLKDEVDNIHLCSATGKAVGSGVGILGGLATIAGFALTFSKDENMRQLGKKMTKNGSLASILGGTGAAATSLIEIGLNKKKLEEAKVCLEKDKQLTEKLMPWLRNVKNLDMLFEKVFGCNILTDNWQDICDVFKHMLVIAEQAAYVLEDVEKIISSTIKKSYSDVVKGYNENNSFDLQKLSNKIRHLNDKTKLILKAFCKNPAVRKAVKEMYNSFKRSPITLDLCKINLNIRLELKVLGSTEMLILSKIVEGNIAGNVLKAVSQSILAAAKISVDVITFLSAVDDICKRKSYYSELLEKTELVLNEELKIIKKAYNELNK